MWNSINKLIRPLRQAAALAAAVCVLAVATAPAAQALNPTPVVHSEFVTVGPYRLQASFSQWPVVADRAMDFTFAPSDGIINHTAKLIAMTPDNRVYEHRRPTNMMLRRYTQDHDRWGLDSYLLPQTGTWHFQISMDGPQGPGSGELALPVGPRPGPPLSIAWLVGLLPLLVTIPLCTVLGIRSRRNRKPNSWSWD
ncbi:hypothetical protein [Kitasatospora sp. MAP5-34]|uniref:hypothetical protein n=1 Tax=Kitasatospora sp. MAP5-34 TaxID=3035102 RepID=UPI002474A93B|nr:hypothetical protein [Kitasatospora sp. MAP5-34]MDH6580221.1 hypothetical protein [Kitasatospora sp. MAP5-34]